LPRQGVGTGWPDESTPTTDSAGLV
jgi:hypothetical protein